MKNMSRRFVCLVLALSLCLALLAGCGKDKGGAPDPTPEATKQTFDPAAYVRGGLDAVYLGEYSDEYLAMLGGETKESCDERYERGMQVSLEVFCEYFGIDLAQCSDATRTELLDLMRRMYKCAKYEIGPTAQNDYPGFAQDAANRIAAGELDKSSQSFKDWWAKSICGMVSARLASPEYLAAQTVSVTLAKNDGGAYGFAGTSLSDVDALIVSYPA